MIKFPNAKINLGLNIVSKRPDGYHNLETVFYPVPIQDALEVTILHKNDVDYELNVSGIELSGNNDDNLVVKAYKLLKQDFPDMPPVKISLYKHIPSGAGMGGGSADASFMLKMLNEKFKLDIPNGQLEVYAAKLGADCPVFIENKPVYAEGIGEIFTPIDLDLKGWHIAIVKPDIFVSTKAAFAKVTPSVPALNLKDIIRMPVEEWKGKMKNDFEESVFSQFPTIAAIKDRLYECGATYASMSGSGSALYGLFNPDLTEHEINAIAPNFEDCFYEILTL